MKNLFSKLIIYFAVFIAVCSLNYSPNIYGALSAIDQKLDELVKEKKQISFKSSEGIVFKIWSDWLSPNCIARLKRLDYSSIDDLIVETSFSIDVLNLAKKFSLWQKPPISKAEYATHLVALVDTCLCVKADDLYAKAQELCYAAVFFGFNDKLFNGVIAQCKKALEKAGIEYNDKEFLYTFKDFYQELESENIKSVSEDPSEEPNEAEKGGSYIRKALNRMISMPASQRRRLAFEVVSSYAKTDPKISLDCIMDTKTCQDLEVVCGSQSDPTHSLAAAVDCASSELGKVLIASQLMSPTINADKLEARQEIIQELLSSENSEAFQELDNLFANFFKEKKYENNILQFWDNNDYCFKQLTGYTKYTDENSQKLGEWLSNNEINATVSEGGQLLTYKVISGAAEYTKIIPLKEIYKNVPYAEFFIKSLPTIFGLLTHKPTECIKKYINLTLENCGFPKAVINLTAANIAANLTGHFLTFLQCMVEDDGQNIYSDNAKTMAETFSCQQERLVLLAEYIKNIQRIALCVEKLPKLKELLPSLSSLDIKTQTNSLFSHFAKEFTGPGSFDQFINKLYAVYDDKKNESWNQYYYFGRVLATHRLADHYKDNLLPSIMALAELDMYLSCARLVKKSKQAGKPICFPKFMDFEDGDKPFLKLTDFWSPTIFGNPVPNTLALGTNNQPQNALITGPNTGGKSTAMRGIGHSIVMGQSLGLMTAKKAIFTPFSSIATYMNISDDPAKGLSLFKASGFRAKELLNKPKETTGCSFTLFDEMFNGTNPKCGEHLTYATLDTLDTAPDHSSNISIATTHFPCVNKLREDQNVNFAYCRVAEKGEGKEKSFKILPGIYTSTNAFDVAEEIELDPEVLKKAKQSYQEEIDSNPQLDMLLDFLKTLPEDALQPMLQKYFKEFVKLVLHPVYNVQFMDIAQERQLDLNKILNITHPSGRSILHYAALWDYKNADIIKQLIANGADIAIKDTHAKSPRNYAFKDSIMENVLYDAILELIKQKKCKLLYMLHNHSGFSEKVHSVAISGNTLVTGGSKGNVYVYEAKNGNYRFNLEHTSGVTAVATNGNIVVVGCEDSSTRVYSAEDGQHLFDLAGHSDRINSVAISGNFIVTSSRDKKTKVYNIGGEFIEELQGHKAVINDNYNIAISNAGIVQIYNMYDEDYTFNTEKHKSLFDIAISNKNFATTSPLEGLVRVYDIESQKNTVTYGVSKVTAVAIHDDILIAGNLNGDVKICSAKKPEYICTLDGHKANVFTLAINNNLIASGDRDGCVRVYQLPI